MSLGVTVTVTASESMFAITAVCKGLLLVIKMDTRKLSTSATRLRYLDI